MAGFRIEKFKGIRPRISAKKLPPGEAQTAQNANLGSGDLEPWDEKDAGTAVDDTWYNKTIYRYDNAGSPVWFEFSAYVDVARGPIKDDSIERTYYTGIGDRPRMTYTTIADAGGGGPYPEDYRDLGITQPPNALQASSQDLPETVDDADRYLDNPECDAFVIDVVEWTTYPGTGTRDQTWTLNSGALGSIAFQIDVGQAFKVKYVVSDTSVRLVAADNPGIAVRTANSDKTTVNDWHPMDEGGTTQEADFLGWQIPEIVMTSPVDHLLRVGDVIRVTSAPTGSAPGVIEYYSSAVEVQYEQGWDASPTATYESGATVYREFGARISASANEGDVQYSLNGRFYYEVDRSASEASELQDRQYVYTYVSNLGEEGPPSAVSNIVVALEGDNVELTGFDDVYTDPNLTKRDIENFRIYRTNSSEQGTEFQFVREYPVGSASFPVNRIPDYTPSEDLGEILQTDTWFPPDENMEGVTTWLNGMLVGFYKKTLFVCEPFQPHAWPAEYDQAANYNIVGLASFGNAIAVLTEGWPYILTGSHPRNLNLRPIKVKQACSNKESITTDNDRVYYASPDGLIELSVNGVRNVTEDYMEKDDWASYVPTKMRSSFHDGAYYGFYDADDSVTQPDITAALTGTFVSATTNEDDIVTGGKTIIITLSGGTWKSPGTFNASRQDIIDAFVSNKSETNGWNAERANIAVTDVVRTSGTVVTITLSALADYEISETEILTARFPTTVFTISPADTIQADSTLTVAPDSDFTSSAFVLHPPTDSVFFSDGDADGWLDRGLFVDLPGVTSANINTANSNRYTPIAYDPNAGRVLVGAAVYEDGAWYGQIHTSEDNGISWAKRADLYAAAVQISNVFVYPEYNTFVATSVSTSPDKIGYRSEDGLNWVPMFIGDQAGLNEYRATGHFESYKGRIYVPVFDDLSSGVPKIAMSNNLNEGPLEDFWTLETLAFATRVTDTNIMTVAAGNGKVLVATDPEAASGTELCYKDVDDADQDGDTTWTSIGTLTGAYDPIKLVYGGSANGWLCVTSDFRVSQCDAGDEETIGNWSSYSAAKAAVTVSNAFYDPGDGVTAGWGWVVVGDTGTNQAVIYTSTDGATWTLQETFVSTAGHITAIAFQNKLTDVEKGPI